jgi:hypothetical protein
MQLTVEEIRDYREQLIDYDYAIKALDIIEDIEGDLEDAATSLALASGQTPDRIDWLDGLAKRCRVAICEQNLRADLEDNYLATTIKYLFEKKICPPLLITPIVIYVVKQGVNDFCMPLTYQITSENQEN